MGLHPEQTYESSVIPPELVHGQDLAHCHLPDRPFFLSMGPFLVYTAMCIIFQIVCNQHLCFLTTFLKCFKFSIFKNVYNIRYSISKCMYDAVESRTFTTI